MKSTRNPIQLTLLIVAAAAVLLMNASAHAQQLFGACCFSDGSCVESAPQDWCESNGGVIAGAFCSSVNCPTAGCTGQCGGQSPWGCWCDEFCHVAGDCCPGVCQHCTGSQVPGCSCQGNCGGQTPGGCWCDNACVSFGDCCLDFCDQCPLHNPEACIPHNTCEDAEPVGDGVHESENLYTPSGVASSCSGADAKDRWFAYTASCSGTATASTCGEFTSGNVAISIFTGCPSQGGTEIACSDVNPDCQTGKSGPEDHAAVSWSSEQGVTYLVRVSATSEFDTAFFNPVLFDCAIPPDGACCFTSDCVEVTDPECASLGGEWLGPLTSCDLCDLCDSWRELGGGVNGSSRSIMTYQGQLVIAGDFTTAGSQVVNHIARWDEASETWEGFGFGFNAAVSAMTIYEGDLVVGGSFTASGSTPLNRLARWNGSTWQPFIADGETANGVNNFVSALAVFDGELIVGGIFSHAGDQVVNRIVRWNGSTWQPFVDANGLIGLGYSGPTPAVVFALREYDGDLIVGGQFTHNGPDSADPLAQSLPNIARWDGQAWHNFGGVSGLQIPNVRDLSVFAGELIVGGHFTFAGGISAPYIARWNPTNLWRPMGAGFSGFNTTLHSITTYNGDLIVGGTRLDSSGGQQIKNIARWNAASGIWMPFVANGVIGVGNPDIQFPGVTAVGAHNRELVLGGSFTEGGGLPLNRLATWRDCDLLPICGDPNAGDCFAANDSPSCDDPLCCEVVCLQDPFCCENEWDDVCVMQAEHICLGAPAGECGSPLSGDCFAVSDTPGCKSGHCCEAVCDEDPSCCASGGNWHEGCVDLAEDICNVFGFMNSGGADGTIDEVLGMHGLFELEAEYTNGSIVKGDLCCGLDELPESVTARIILCMFDGPGTVPGFHAGPENAADFSLQFGNLDWNAIGMNSLLALDATFEAVGMNSVIATDLIWVGPRLVVPCDPNDPFGPVCGLGLPLNFPLTIKGIDADTGEPFEILYTESTETITPTTCIDIGCCEGHCGGMSPIGCACDAGCFDRGDCCSDVNATCAFCPSDLSGPGGVPDGTVDVFDLLDLISQWGPCANPSNCPADLSGPDGEPDGTVDVFDLLHLINNWGSCP